MKRIIIKYEYSEKDRGGTGGINQKFPVPPELCVKNVKAQQGHHLVVREIKKNPELVASIV